jgi:hypothetical protein
MERLPDDVLRRVLREPRLRAVCAGWRALVDDAHPFRGAGPWELPAGSSRARFEQHARAERLGFRHESAGVPRRVVLWHPTGCVRTALRVVGGAVSLTLLPVRRAWRGARRAARPRRAARDCEEAEEGAPECIKCGFRTWRDYCPDCGRPAL